MNDDELRRTVLEQLQIARRNLGATDEPGGNSLDLTSLELVRMLVNLEELLDTEIDEMAIMNARLDTVDDIIALLRESISVGSGAVE